MRHLPDFPEYCAARPPQARRWLGAGALLALLAGGGIALLREGQAGAGTLFVGMVVMLILMGVCWLFALLYYRFSLHHARTWQQETAQMHDQWWIAHRRQFALQDVVLVGPAGVEKMDWLRVLQRESRAPVERNEANGKALRIARTFSPDVSEREKQLARLLVLQWKTEREEETVISPQRCYWQGSVAGWLAFAAQMQTSFPGVALPVSPEPWLGEHSLSEIAAALDGDEQGTQYLIAGCESAVPSTSRTLPAGEAAVLWLAQAEGPVTLSRGEVFDATGTPSLQQVCERAQQQSCLEREPEACILFSHPQQSALAGSGWNVTGHLQDSFWGEIGKLDALVVISLAAIFAQNKAQACGWIAADPLHHLAIGIVKHHENR